MSIIRRKAEAEWTGSVSKGHGLVTTESGVVKKATISLGSRFQGEGKETNPEELIAAAAASCFSMALSKVLGEQGAEALKIVTRAHVDLEVTAEGPVLRALSLAVEGLVPGISDEDFQEAVETTSDTCPVMQLLRPGFSEVSVESRLLSA